jgi:predicted transcriptional regulator
MKTARVHLRLDGDLVAKSREVASRQKMTLTALITQCLLAVVERDKMERETFVEQV